jgi:MoaA/NifB/PqqE/SkfB family radical SAM enzyme
MNDSRIPGAADTAIALGGPENAPAAAADTSSRSTARTYIADLQEGAYRADKISHHADRLETLRQGATTVPVTVKISISDLCNHDCSFCGFRMEDNLNNAWFGETHEAVRTNNPSRKIPTARAKGLLSELAAFGVRAIEFTGGGEPTAHPDHQEIFEHCLDVGMEAALITNGQRVGERLDDILARFTWVRFSIDAALSSTWAAIRRVPPGNFARVLGNAGRLIAHGTRVGSDTHVGAGFVVYEENWSEIYAAVQLFKETGFDSVRLSALFNSSQKIGHFDAFAAEASRLCERAKDDFEDGRFHVANNFEARLDDLRHGSRPTQERCWYQELAPYIGGDQNLYRCCNTAYNPVGYLGSLKERPFSDLWTEVSTSGALRQFRPERQCELCMFNNRNQHIDKLVLAARPAEPARPPPTHPNFI